MIISTEIPNIQAFIKTLNLFDSCVKEAVQNGLHEGAEIIATEQKRLISARPSKTGSNTKLASLIKVGTIRTKKNGNVYCDVGYNSEAIKEAPESVVIEFGRPASRKNKMKQNRHGKDYEITIGNIDAYSHIRRGFDNKIAEAAQKMIDTVNQALDRAERS